MTAPEWHACVCCERRTLGPWFAVTPPGRLAAQLVCFSCAGHVVLSAGTASLELPDRCPAAPRLRLVRPGDT